MTVLDGTPADGTPLAESPDAGLPATAATAPAATAPAASTPAPSVPGPEPIAGRYRILDRLGDGGMAEVYRARDESLGRDVAVKVFRRELASAADLERQRGEVRILASLSHPSLVTLFDAVSTGDGRGVLVLEYVPGTDLRGRLADGALPSAVVAGVGADVARALAYIHGVGVVHRDVSPGNILLPDAQSAGVDAKLTDLGIARLVDDARVTTTGTVLGTASYLSPEQAQGRPLTGASDVYSLGLVLLEALTGRREFPGTAVESAMARLARDPDVPAELDPTWRALLRAMTARDPVRRPRPEQVAEHLAALRAGGSAPQLLLPDTVGLATAPLGTADVLEPTKVLPAAESRTQVLSPAASQVDAGTHTTETRDRSRRPSRGRRIAFLICAAVLAAAIVVITLLVAIPRTSSAQPDPVPSYPAVGGVLGEHLRQLEKDVSLRQDR